MRHRLNCCLLIVLTLGTFTRAAEPDAEDEFILIFERAFQDEQREDQAPPKITKSSRQLEVLVRPDTRFRTKYTIDGEMTLFTGKLTRQEKGNWGVECTAQICVPRPEGTIHNPDGTTTEQPNCERIRTSVSLRLDETLVLGGGSCEGTWESVNEGNPLAPKRINHHREEKVWSIILKRPQKEAPRRQSLIPPIIDFDPPSQ